MEGLVSASETTASLVARVRGTAIVSRDDASTTLSVASSLVAAIACAGCAGRESNEIAPDRICAVRLRWERGW